MENKATGSCEEPLFDAEQADLESELTELSEVTLAVEDTAHGLSRLLHCDPEKQIEQFEASIEGMLTRLDDFCGLLDMVRSDTSLCLQRTLPAVLDKQQEMNVVFERIEHLETLVTHISGDVSAMERSVEQAERELPAHGFSVKKVLSLLPSFGRKRSESRGPVPRYEAPPIFRVDELIKPVDSASTS